MGEFHDNLIKQKNTLVFNENTSEQLKKMGIASRQRVATSYTWDATADQYLALLENILEGGRQASEIDQVST